MTMDREGGRPLSKKGVEALGRRMRPWIFGTAAPGKWFVGPDRGAGVLVHVLRAFASDDTRPKKGFEKKAGRANAQIRLKEGLRECILDAVMIWMKKNPLGVNWSDGSLVTEVDAAQARFQETLKSLLEDAVIEPAGDARRAAEVISQLAARHDHDIPIDRILEVLDGLRPKKLKGERKSAGAKNAAAKLLGGGFSGAKNRLRVAATLKNQAAAAPVDVGGPVALFYLLAVALGFSGEQALRVAEAVDPIVTPIWREEPLFPPEPEPGD